MTRKELYENKLQMDYFSDAYIRFEEDFQKYSAMNVPLTFLIDDILRTMAMNQKNYFVLNKENAKDGREHRFYFRVVTEKSVLEIGLIHTWESRIAVSSVLSVVNASFFNTSCFISWGVFLFKSKRIKKSHYSLGQRKPDHSEIVKL